MLDRLLSDAEEWRGGIVFIQGEPGIGKTALLSTALKRAAELGLVVLRGAGDELTTSVPLLPFPDALHLDGAGVHGEDLPRLIRERCGTTPAVLALEDLQWADE